MAVKVKVIDQKGKQAGQADLPGRIFASPIKEHLVFDTVLAQQASRRQGTAKTKTRAEVRGGGKKPYRQKGTGHARQGSIRSPLLPGGGKVFGPKPRGYGYNLSKKVRAQALSSVLSQKAKEGKIMVLEAFSVQKPSSKTMASLLAEIKWEKVLVVDMDNELLYKSVRNLASAKYIDVRGLNVFDLLKYENVLLSPKSIKKIEERIPA